MDLSRPKSIIIPDDYDKGEIQLDDGSTSKYLPTSCKYGTGFAITLPEGTPPNKFYYIVVRKELVLPLLPDRNNFEWYEDLAKGTKRQCFYRIVTLSGVNILLAGHQARHFR